MHVLIDIGGTKTRIAYINGEDTFSEPYVFETPSVFEEWLTEVSTHLDSLKKEDKITHIIAGFPGTLKDKTTIVHAPNIPTWDGVNLKKSLEGKTGATVYIENDTSLVGLGEAVYGAGKSHDIVAYITISTGVNGVRIVHKEIDKNIFGFEIGHTIIENGQDVEHFIGGRSLEKRFNAPSRTIKDISVWEKISHYAAIFAANTVMYWSPSVVVFGGPVMNDLHKDVIMREAHQFLSMYPEKPIFVRSSLKDFGGLYGGLALSKQLSQNVEPTREQQSKKERDHAEIKASTEKSSPEDNSPLFNFFKSFV